MINKIIIGIILQLTLSITTHGSLLNDPFQYTANSYAFNQCPEVDTSQIGVVFLNIPYVSVLKNTKSSFNLHNYMSLILLAKFLKPSEQDRFLFYYVNDDNRPSSNHYNRWLDDSHWSNRIPNETLKYIKINYFKSSRTRIASKENINFFYIFEKLVEQSWTHFDKTKKWILFVTSDAIVGPNILSCFSLDLYDKEKLESNKFMFSEKSHKKVAFDCFKKLNTRLDSRKFDFYSFLYQLPGTLNKHFSGLFIWKVNNYGIRLSYDSFYDQNEIEIDFDGDFISFKKSKELIHVDVNTIVNVQNLYKCSTRDDILTLNKRSYENTYCLFGYESFRQNDLKFEDFFNKRGYFYDVVRSILFDSTRVISYQTLSKAHIPNIVHLVWFGSDQAIFKLIDFLCLKSLIRIVRPEKIKIHGDIQPFGHLWNEIKTHTLIEWVHRERPLFKFGQNFTQAPIQHLADIARLEIMYEEGGFYTDFDILWVKPVEHYRYLDVDLIASNDITSYCVEFVNSIQIGAFMSPAKSPFIKKWLQAYERYHLYPNDYAAISMCEPYKLYEKEPHRVLIDNRLQMIYFNGWSSFIPRYVDVEFSRLSEWQNSLDWFNDGTHGYHLPRNTALHNEFEFEKANRSSLPVVIANFILNLK